MIVPESPPTAFHTVPISSHELLYANKGCDQFLTLIEHFYHRNI